MHRATDQEGANSGAEFKAGEHPVIFARHWSKTFAGRTVLHSIDLAVRRGQVHGLVGQNGSGKSTFIKILSGFYAPDPGARLAVSGQDVPMPLRPNQPSRLGIAFVHQDLGLLDDASILENLRVGRYETRFLRRVPWRVERNRVRQVLDELGLRADSTTPVAALSPVQRARLAIARALEDLRTFPTGLLVLDEPTVYLPRNQVEELFHAIRQVADSGFGVLFVSHDLDEVGAITDWVSVLRDGHLVASEPSRELSDEELSELILGFKLDKLYPAPRVGKGDTVLKVEAITDEYVLPLTFEVRKGEIVGLSGLLGSGHDRVPYMLFGATLMRSGRITLGRTPIETGHLSPSHMLSLGVALVPADRHRYGAVGLATVTENLTLVTLRRYFSRFVLDKHKERIRVLSLLEKFNIRPSDPSKRFIEFSGGNQQKVVLAKWLETSPSVLLLHEPTQGVDVGARRQILASIRAAADRGAAVLIASTEYEDMAHLCDRVLIFRRGSMISELDGHDLTHERVLELCFGGRGTDRGPSVSP